MNELGNYASLAHAARLAGGELLLDAQRRPDFFAVMKPGGTAEAAFAVGGMTIPRVLVGKYEACARFGGLCTAPIETPSSAMTFDAALAMALDKGLGYHLLTLAEWALICAHTGAESGHVAADAPTLTGSGAWAYAHNARWTGVWDMSGNLREWVSGYRTVDGEIQIIPDNDAAAAEADELGAAGTLWRAISAGGELVEPGTEGTLHWRFADGETVLDTQTSVEDVSREARLESVQASAAVGQTALNLLGRYGVSPGMTGIIAYNTSGERLAAVGACYKDRTAQARVLRGVYTRESAPEEVGARVCFIDMS